jgi:ElaB/YqjD/DUF883 family membrane-anchored ribosome-binding protein
MFNTLNKTENKHSNGANTSETAAILSAEFHKFVADIEDLVQASTSLTGDELTKVKTELNARIASAKASVVDASSTIVDRAKKAADTSNHYVHEKPWQVIGASSVAGFLIGYLIARLA